MRIPLISFAKKWHLIDLGKIFVIFSIMLNKVLKVFILSFIVLTFSLNAAKSDGYNGNVLKTGISLQERLPDGFYGTWRVASVLSETNSAKTFKKENVDIWNLSKSGDVINLSNPFTGASASITLSYVGDDAIRFSKKGNYDGQVLTDTVEIKLSGDSFSGTNTLVLETLSDVDNSVIKTAKAVYMLKGEKIAGTSIK